MVTMAKPAWWDDLALHYGFTNDGLATISSNDVTLTLTSYVSGHIANLVSAPFTSTQLVYQNTVDDPKKPAIVISSPTLSSEVIGKEGCDYLSGSSSSDILYGGANSDFFVPNGGNDLIIGSENLLNKERDTVSYETALSGIVVDYIDTPSAPPPPPYHAYYTASYDAWAAGTVLTIQNFVTGAGGDVINVKDLLQHVDYTGSSPIGDGYIRLSDIGSGLKIQFDPDGRGALSARQAIVLKGVKLADFSVAENLEAFDDPPVPQIPTPAATDYSVVSSDGLGGTDILYSVENIIGSNFNDTIYGRDDTDNLLAGGAGNDFLSGEAGNDTLIGGSGNDVVNGGLGNDFILMGSGNDVYSGGLGIDIYKFGADYLTNQGVASAVISDFGAGAGGDKLNVAELLRSAHYQGTDPVADGYIRFQQSGSDTEVIFDANGNAPDGGITLATLNGVDSGNLSATENLVTSQPTIILASVLGQSNAAGLRVFAGDSESGLSTLENGLRTQTTYNQVYSVLQDDNRQHLSIAVGGTVVNGDEEEDADLIWWYPSTNKPGELVIRAADMLLNQIATLRAQGDVTPVFVWGQGESDAFAIGSQSTPEARAAAAQKYYNATMSVFNYICDRVGSDIQIYIMQTGNYNVDGAHAMGVSQDTIDKTMLGLTYIRAAQEQMALNNGNVHLAVNYSDLQMLADLPSTEPGYVDTWATDRWHLTYESREVIGTRLADFIAQDLGFEHVIDDPGPYPMSMLQDLTIHEGVGLTLDGTERNNIITGTTGDDTVYGHTGADAIVTGAGNDALYGGADADILMGGTGNDILDGGDGHDTLTGGSGADIFAFSPDTAFTQSDTITDFNILEGDILDLRALINTTFTGIMADFLSLATDGLGNTILSVDPDGTQTGYGPAQIALLQGVINLPVLQNLINAGSILVPVIETLRAGDDYFSIAEDVPLSGNLLADNGSGPDRGPNGSILTISAASFVTTNGGQVTINPDGTFNYIPVANFFGSDSFTYTLSDGRSSTQGIVNITIDPVNDAPVAQNDTFNFAFGQVMQGNIFANNGNGIDSDTELDLLSLSQTSHVTARGITVTIDADGFFIYQPTSDFFGQDSFTYEISDGHGGFDTATVTLNVAAPAGAKMGTAAANIMVGMSKNDIMFGLGGNDIISSSNGNDTVFGGAGDDNILAGKGNDTAYGNDGSDVIKGNQGNDILYGDNGVDILYGEEDSDILYGGAGNDTLRGGSGNDILEGGLGLDFLFGNEGLDSFIVNETSLSALDVVKDFSKTDGDILAIEGLITGFDPLTDAITDFLSVVRTGTVATIVIDRDGTDTFYSAQNLINIQTTQNPDIEQLYNSGQIIIS